MQVSSGDCLVKRGEASGGITLHVKTVITKETDG